MKHSSKFYSKGIDSERSEIEFTIRRPSNSKLKKWDNGAKNDLPEFMENIDKIYKRWRDEILSAISENTIK